MTDHLELPIDSPNANDIPAPVNSGAPRGKGPKKKKPYNKPRKNPQNQKGSESDPFEDNKTGPKDKLAMMPPVVISESVPPPEAQIRNQRMYQSLQTTTLFYFLLVLENMIAQTSMITIPATFIVFPISFDGALFASLICLAIGVKCAAVATSAVGFKLPHKLGRMYSQITKACSAYFTISRGVVFARYFGFFTTPLYETTYPTFMTGASSFLILAAYLFLKHLNRVFANPNGWCNGMFWSQLFPTANGSKAHAIPLDTAGNEIDQWFSFLMPYGDRPDLCFLPVRPFVDHEDFRLTISGYAAAALANTLECSLLHKGKMINEASPKLLIHSTSRDIVDTYFYETPLLMDYTVVLKDMMVDDTLNVDQTPIVDPVTNMPHVIGGRFNQVVIVEDVFELLDDITNGVCTRVASVYYDTTGVDPRTGLIGRDAARCEALMMMQIYGGYIMYDSRFLNAFNLFSDLYFSDGVYYQWNNNALNMDTGSQYLKTFYDLQTFTLELIRGQFSILRERYLTFFKMFKIKIFSVVVTKLTGSTTQLLSYLKSTSNSGPRIFVSPFEYGNNVPSIEGSLLVTNSVIKNDVGYILAPSISVERTVACSFVAPEGRTAVAQYLSRKPWDDMSSNWNEFPMGYI